MSPEQLLVSLFEAGIEAVSGKTSVVRTLTSETAFAPDQIIAVGKAASEMSRGAMEVYGTTIPILIVTKYAHTDTSLIEKPSVKLIEAGHPIPDKNSLLAGKMLLDTVTAMPENSRLLLLISGGASALAECLPENMNLARWQSLNRKMIAGGLSIADINARRKKFSLIKGGKMLAKFHGQEVLVCAISDVKGDKISTIGSGLGDPRLTVAKNRVLLVASNRKARTAVARKAAELGLSLNLNAESLYDDVFVLSRSLGKFLRTAPRGVYLWGGEPTITLPAHPGEGGRNQSLALALAGEISGCENIHILVAGTDGTDGPTDAAGGIVNGSTWRYPDEARVALKEANAGQYLERTASRYVTGPSGTNVMDLVIALVE